MVYNQDMENDYWQRQTGDRPLFPNVEWNKPEQKTKAGRLGIIGGNKLGFASVADSYATALKTGAGEVRILLPDNLKKAIPPIISEVIFGASNPSGSLAKEALAEMTALGAWASELLLIGDAGRNSETAILYEDFVRNYHGPLTVTRDAIDLLRNNSAILVDRPDTLLIASFAQLQKIFQNIYYPKILTFSMQLSNLVETLHKFTITYPVCLAVLHQDHIVVAAGGQITTTPCTDPMKIWRGTTATNAATYWLWDLSKPLESVTASLLK